MNKTFQNNILFIKQINPDFEQKIIDSKCPEWCKIVNSENNHKNILFNKRNTLSPNYNFENPKKGIPEFIKNLNLFKENVTIIIGIGLGYILKEMLRQKENNHIIVVIEPELYFYKECFQKYNFVPWLKSGDLIFIDGNQDTVSQTLGYLDNVKVIQGWNMHIENYAISTKIYEKIILHIQAIINQMMCNIGTVSWAGINIAENDIINLPYVIKHRGITELRNLFEGKPAVCVSTGPSLEKNIHLLMDIQDKVIICAVAQALRPLLSYDIVPDFITTVDFGEVNLDHFKGLYDSKIPLIALNRTYKGIIKKWQGPKFIVSSPNPTAKKTAVDIIAEKETIDQGGSVSHMNLGLAIHLGCDPIVIIGQDLALTDKSHIALADASGKINIKDSSQIKWEVDDPGSNLKDKDYSMGPPIYVPGYFGKSVLTNMGLASFITAFQNIIKCYPNKKIINATEGGAHIEGTSRIPLRIALEKYAQEQINKSILNPLLSESENSNGLINEAIDLLNKDINVLEKIIKNCDIGIKTANDAKNNFKDKDKLNEFLLENEKASLKAQELTKEMPLVNLSIFGTNRLIASREMNIKGKFEDYVNKHYIEKEKGNLEEAEKLKKKADKILYGNKNYLDIRIARNLKILESTKKNSEKLLKLYNESYDLLKRYNETKDESLLTETDDYKPDLSIDNINAYFDKGNWGWPLIEARKIKEINGFNPYQAIINRAIELRFKAIMKAERYQSEQSLKDFDSLKIHNLIKESQKLGLENKIHESFDKLLEAEKINPENEMVLWGMATIYHQQDNQKKSIEYYKRLIELYPDKDTYQFELGRVMIVAKDFKEGLNIIGKVMEKTDKYNWFYLRIGDLYLSAKIHKEALIAYNEYLKHFPYDYTGWKMKAVCLEEMKQSIKAKEALIMALKFKPKNTK